MPKLQNNTRLVLSPHSFHPKPFGLCVWCKYCLLGRGVARAVDSAVPEQGGRVSGQIHILRVKHIFLRVVTQFLGPGRLLSLGDEVPACVPQIVWLRWHLFGGQEWLGRSYGHGLFSRDGTVGDGGWQCKGGSAGVLFRMAHPQVLPECGCRCGCGCVGAYLGCEVGEKGAVFLDCVFGLYSQVYT